MKQDTNIEKLLAESAWLSRLAANLVAKDEEAEDLVQETWLTVLRRSPDRPGIGKGFLRSIVRSRLMDGRRRSRARRRREEETARFDGQFSPSNNVERMAIQKRIVEEIARLPEPLQGTVIRRYLDGHSVTQIAVDDDVSVSAVRKRLHRALEQLRVRLDAEWGERSAWALVLCPFLRPATTTLTSATAGALLGGLHMSAKLKLGILVVTLLALWSANFIWDDDDFLSVGEFAAEGELQDHGPRRVDADKTIGKKSEELVNTSSLAIKSAGERKLRGQVVDEKGVPVVDAVVLAVPLGAYEMPALELPDRLPTSTAKSKMQRARSHVDGSFSLFLPEGVESVSIKASRKDYSPSLTQEFIFGQGDIKIVLRRGFSLRGRVHDLAGNVIAGASISYRARVDGFSVERRGQSHEDGAFEIVGIPISDPFGSGIDQELLLCEGAGFAPRMMRKPIDYWTRRISRDGKVSLDIMMSRGGSVSGQVVDSTTLKPIANSDVELWSLEGREATRIEGVKRLFRSMSGPRLIAKTSTDARGSYNIDHVPAQYGGLLTSTDIYDGGFVVRVLRPGFAVAAGRLETLALEGATCEVNLKLYPIGGIGGRVVDQDNRPVPDYNVYVRLKDWELIDIDMRLMVRAPPPRPEFLGWRHNPGKRGLWLTQTDVSGHWSLSLIPCVAGQATRVTIRQGGEVRELELWAGDAVDLGDVAVHQDFVFLRGLVVDAEEQPVQGAQIWQNEERGVTGFDGRFDLKVPKWENGSLGRGDFSIRMPGFVSTTSVIPKTIDDNIVTFQLENEHVLAGTVSDSMGTFVPGAHVWVFVAGKLSRNRVWSDRLGHALTGPDGRFHIDKLPNPPWDIEFATNFRESESTQLSVASDEKELDLVLPFPIPESTGLSVQVTNANGGPIVASIQASIFSKEVGETIAGNRESLITFSWDSVPVGEYQLEVTTKGYARVAKKIVLVKGPLETLSVIMSSGIDVVVRVRFPKDVPKEVRWGIHIAHPIHGNFGDGGNGPGQLAFDDLAPGRWQITANGRLRRDGRVFLAEPIELDLAADGEVVFVDMMMKEAANILLELPVQESDDPVLPDEPDEAVGGRQQADQHQAWWNLRQIYLDRAGALRLVVRRDGRLLHDGSPLKFGSLDFDARVVRLKRKVLPGQYVFELRRNGKLLWTMKTEIKPGVVVTVP